MFESNLKLAAIVCMAGVCQLFIGCNSRPYDLADVSGQVLLDDRPLAGVQVTFQPKSIVKDNPNPGPSSDTTTDSEGRYTLRTVKGNLLGAVVGLHTVRLTKMIELESRPDREESSMPDMRLPKRTRDGSLQFEVPVGGTDKADFDLQTQRKKR